MPRGVGGGAGTIKVPTVGELFEALAPEPEPEPGPRFHGRTGFINLDSIYGGGGQVLVRP